MTSLYPRDNRVTVLIRALFDPSDDDQIKDAWGWFGVVLLGVVGIGALYLYNAR